MAGQIIKRGDNTWLVRVFTGRDANGKRRYINKTIKGKKREAQSYLSESLTKISAGIFVEPVKLTVDEYLDKWLEAAARPRLSERTFADYKEVLRRYVRPKLGSVRLINCCRLTFKLCTHGWASRVYHLELFEARTLSCPVR